MPGIFGCGIKRIFRQAPERVAGEHIREGIRKNNVCCAQIVAMSIF